MSDAPINVDDVEPQRWEVGELAATRWRLGAAAGAARIGVAVIAIDQGKRSTPPHSHADEEEQFYVLEGSGLSYQTSGSRDARAYAIRAGDFLWHPANGDAHTLIAGPDGLKILVVAEGSRTHITHLPRTKQFWLGPRWSPADSPPPFAADSQLEPLAIPEPSERPPTIRNLDELELHEGRDGVLAYAYRGLVERDEGRLVLAHDAMPPDTHNTELHFHTAREEAWYVLSGAGHARLGDELHPLRPGSFWLRRPNGGVGHRIEVGPEGMGLLTMGDLVPGDLVVYPERRKVRLARGVELPY
jgi:uncharacterized cupin superfamily protein